MPWKTQKNDIHDTQLVNYTDEDGTVSNYFELFIINQVFNTNICEISLQRIAL